MITRFSKPLASVMAESANLRARDAEMRREQQRIVAFLEHRPDRKDCVLCRDSLASSRDQVIKHRGVDFLACRHCGHLQTVPLPPEDYPYSKVYGADFAKVYDDMPTAAYHSRLDRIYQPKLDWFFECAPALGTSLAALKGASWVELGSGSGYFLKALQQSGVTNFLGLERDTELVRQSHRYLPPEQSITYEQPLTSAVREYPADVYAAFFVVEHIHDAQTFFTELGKRPSGTCLYFSVPTFGFSTVLESLFDRHFARNLDSVYHTQLFTDESIDYCLELAGFEKKAVWIFGQDASDLSRLLTTRLQENYFPGMASKLSEQILALQDDLQSVFDKHALADARHVIAVKK